MKERPILFSGAMVQAILGGCKTQTRRVMKPQPAPRGSFCTNDPQDSCDAFISWCDLEDIDRLVHPDIESHWHTQTCPYGVPGDRLWVRETFCAVECGDSKLYPDARIVDGVELWYRADIEMPLMYRLDDSDDAPRWRPSIFMPRAYSRITLEITDVRIERVQNISESDARAEGFPMWCESVKHRPIGSKEEHKPYLPQEWFHGLWDSINAERGYGWSANPWVWVVGFKVVQR